MDRFANGCLPLKVIVIKLSPADFSPKEIDHSIVPKDCTVLLSNTVRAIKSYIYGVNGNILLIFHPIKQLLSVFSVYFLHVNIELCPVFTKGASRVTDNEEILHRGHFDCPLQKS